MNPALRIALIGDYNPGVTAHVAIPQALSLAANGSARAVEAAWMATTLFTTKSEDLLSPFHGIWCVPNSPYASMAGALCAIRYARESGCPFLGTCGGFQHAVIEYARNVLGWAEAEHAETAPDALRPVISPLTCTLVEATNTVRFFPSSRIARAYGTDEAIEADRKSV